MQSINKPKEFMKQEEIKNSKVDGASLIHPCILKVSSKLAQNCKVTAFSGEAVPP